MLIIQFNKLSYNLTVFVIFIIQPKTMMGHICIPCLIVMLIKHHNVHYSTSLN